MCIENYHEPPVAPFSVGISMHVWLQWICMLIGSRWERISREITDVAGIFSTVGFTGNVPVLPRVKLGWKSEKFSQHNKHAVGFIICHMLWFLNRLFWIHVDGFKNPHLHVLLWVFGADSILKICSDSARSNLT